MLLPPAGAPVWRDGDDRILPERLVQDDGKQAVKNPA